MVQARAKEPTSSPVARVRRRTSPFFPTQYTSSSDGGIVRQWELPRWAETKTVESGRPSKSRTAVVAVKSAAKKPKWKFGFPPVVVARARASVPGSGQHQKKP